MSTYKTKCDICGAVNEVPTYGEWDCRQCGQGYTYDEGHQIRLTDAQWAMLRNRPRWIPVEERLPEEGQVVLLYYGGDTDPIAVGKYLGLGGVTHWMPLPEPPAPKCATH